MSKEYIERLQWSSASCTGATPRKSSRCGHIYAETHALKSSWAIPFILGVAAIAVCACGPSKKDLARMAAEQNFRKHIAEMKLAAVNHSIDDMNEAAKVVYVSFTANQTLLEPFLPQTKRLGTICTDILNHRAMSDDASPEAKQNLLTSFNAQESARNDMYSLPTDLNNPQYVNPVKNAAFQAAEARFEQAAAVANAQHAAKMKQRWQQLEAACDGLLTDLH